MRKTMLLLVTMIGVMTLTSGCLVIGNRGGLGTDEKQMLQQMEQRLNETEAKLYRIEKGEGKKSATCEELQQENERLRKLLTENNIPV